MTPENELMFLSPEELVGEMEELQDIADREFAHERADAIIVIALLAAANDELPNKIALELVRIYRGLDRWYG